MVSFYLGLRVLLFIFKSNQFSPGNPQWRSEVGDGPQTLRSAILTHAFLTLFLLKIEETYTFLTIRGAESLRDLNISSTRPKCSVRE